VTIWASLCGPAGRPARNAVAIDGQAIAAGMSGHSDSTWPTVSTWADAGTATAMSRLAPNKTDMAFISDTPCTQIFVPH
jgi:photosystem II stability/assembly factor-like uncharacterized protein